MALAKDEAWGLLIACAIGGSALGLFAYRELAAPPPVVVEPASDPLADREAFAEALEVAFVADNTDAAVSVAETTLEIAWFPCGKPMLDRLLRRPKDALTRQVREASGLSIAKLETLGFTRVVCDNTRGSRAVDDLAPRKRR